MSYKPFKYEGKMHYPALPGKNSVCGNCAYHHTDCMNLRDAAMNANPAEDSNTGCTDIIWQVGEKARINYITFRLTT